MPWNSGTFTRSNGTYSGANVWLDDETNLFDIVSGRHDTHDEDMADGVNACLNRDGENAMAANLAMGSHLITGLTPGTATGQATEFNQMETAIAVVAASVSALTDVDPGTLDGQLLRWEATGSTYEPSSAIKINDAGLVGVGTDPLSLALSVSVSAWVGRPDTATSAGISLYEFSGTTFMVASERDTPFVAAKAIQVLGTAITIIVGTSNIDVGTDGSVRIDTGGVERLRIESGGDIYFPTFGAGTLQTTAAGRVFVS
jgi:hypothetical protein